MGELPPEFASLRGRFEIPHTPRVLVVGGFLLDRWIECDVERISPEAPVPVAREKSVRVSAGGAGNAVKNLARLGADVVCWGVVGHDEDGGFGYQLRNDLIGAGVGLKGLPVVSNRCNTVTRTRIVQGQHHLLRLDNDGAPAPLSDWWNDESERRLSDLLHKCGCVLISDYVPANTPAEVIERIVRAAAEADVPVIVDPGKGADWARYDGGAMTMVPNRKELHEKSSSDEEIPQIETLARNLQDRGLPSRAPCYIVTLDRDGCLYVPWDAETTYFPATARDLVDVCGAGDVFAATLAYFVARPGFTWPEAVYCANLAAGVSVGYPGTWCVTREALGAAMVEDAERRGWDCEKWEREGER